MCLAAQHERYLVEPIRPLFQLALLGVKIKEGKLPPRVMD